MQNQIFPDNSLMHYENTVNSVPSSKKVFIESISKKTLELLHVTDA